MAQGGWKFLFCRMISRELNVMNDKRVNWECNQWSFTSLLCLFDFCNQWHLPRCDLNHDHDSRALIECSAEWSARIGCVVSICQWDGSARALREVRRPGDRLRVGTGTNDPLVANSRVAGAANERPPALSWSSSPPGDQPFWKALMSFIVSSCLIQATLFTFPGKVRLGKPGQIVVDTSSVLRIPPSRTLWTTPRNDHLWATCLSNLHMPTAHTVNHLTA